MSYKVKVLPSNHEFTVNDDQTVLDAALDAGIVLPYSCKSGTCSTCRGKIVSGDYDAGQAPKNVLEPEQLEQGFTLLCQAKALSDMVIEAQVVGVAGDIQVRKMPARIMEIKDVADGIKIVNLQLPASQFFNYHPGQYLEFIMRDGKRRSYSMANAPSETNLVELHIRHVPGGAFTDQLFGITEPAIKERAIVRTEGPFGTSFLNETSDKSIIFVASGTGFAPIKAMMQRLIETGSKRQVYLYWGGRRPHDIYMQDLAKQWESELSNYKFIPVVSDALDQDNWEGRTGFVHNAVMQDINDMSNYEVYACGTPIMVESARKDFTEKCSLLDENFFADAFTDESDLHK